jgi:anti-sigma regulatory factor (Ser/Thr protein kinase)
VTIADDGPGFDPSTVVDFLISDDLTKAEGCGRGLMLLKYAVDEIRFNEKGNEVTLVIRA